MPESLFHGNLVTSSRILYTPSPFARENLLFLQETGSLKATSPHTSSREGLNSYLLFLVRSGQGFLTYGGNRYDLAAGDCVFIDCRLPYSHTTSDDLWELSWAHFSGVTMPGIYNKYSERGGRPLLHLRHPEKVLSCLLDLHQMACSDDHIRDMKINEILAGLLSVMMEESWQPEEASGGSGQASASGHVTAKVKAYLDENFTRRISLDDLAQRFFVNKYTLSRSFRAQYDTTIGTYLTSLRIGYAKQCLRFTDLTMEEIGQKCGIGDAAYFSRVFEKVEGESPSQFRNAWHSRGNG